MVQERNCTRGWLIVDRSRELYSGDWLSELRIKMALREHLRVGLIFSTFDSRLSRRRGTQLIVFAGCCTVCKIIIIILLYTKCLHCDYLSTSAVVGNQVDASIKTHTPPQKTQSTYQPQWLSRLWCWGYSAAISMTANTTLRSALYFFKIKV